MMTLSSIENREQGNLVPITSITKDTLFVTRLMFHEIERRLPSEVIRNHRNRFSALLTTLAIKVDWGSSSRSRHRPRRKNSKYTSKAPRIRPRINEANERDV